MSDPYIGEIRMFGGNFAPVGWAFCNGATVPIAENDTLFNLIGTTYGGDGQNTFNLPDLQGRVPVHAGQGPGISQSYILGQQGGVEQVTLNTQQMPAHNHAFVPSGDPANQITANGGTLATPVSLATYFSAAPDANMNPAAVQNTGGSQPHENMQSFLVISFIISLYGIYPNPS